MWKEFLTCKRMSDSNIIWHTLSEKSILEDLKKKQRKKLTSEESTNCIDTMRLVALSIRE
jgi:hypothetical protein